MNALGGRRRKAVEGSSGKKLDRREAWQAAASLVGGELVEGDRPSKDRVLLHHGPWRIWLDTQVVHTGQVTVTYTRVRAYFPGWREVKLLVRKRNVFDRLLGALGWGSPPPMSRSLTERYVVKGKPEARLPSLFSAQGLTEAILALPSLRLEVKRPSRKSRRAHGDDAGVVLCRTTGVITEPERLAGMVVVVRETLDALERVGEAREKPTDRWEKEDADNEEATW